MSDLLTYATVPTANLITVTVNTDGTALPTMICRPPTIKGTP